MIGAFGDIVFESSDKRLLTFDNLIRTYSATYEEHKIINYKPRLEFTGPDCDELTFTVNFNIWDGVFPQTEMNRWLEKCRNGKEEYFIIDEWFLGVNKWVITSVSNPITVIANNGKILKASVDITLKEYP